MTMLDARRIATTVILLFVSWSCAPVLTRTPVQGYSRAIAELAGEWEGSYTGDQSGRVGSIVFRLQAMTDTAEGDVLMTPRRVLETNEVDVHRFPTTATGTASQRLTIRFVRVSGDEVSGVLDPYRDPDCGCTLSTTFVGILRGDTIEGTFQSNGEGIHHLPSSGRWRVTRRHGP
jgi:hypothetical protein